jgi:hypothetical protein
VVHFKAKINRGPYFGAAREFLISGGFLMKKDQQGSRMAWATLALVAVLAVLCMSIACVHQDEEVKFQTPYQAVLLTNGQVYFGQLQGYGTPHPVLTNVFYVISQTNPETKQVNNVLIKRGKELHEPDRMYLNPRLIVFVEPVGASSKVAQLIAQAK